MSAIEVETADGPIEIINVLFALHPNFGAQELVGPLEVLTNALHKTNDPGNTTSRLVYSEHLTLCGDSFG